MAEVELPDLEELEEKKENKFGKRVALVTACFAVMLAITSLGGNNATKEMMLAQQQASDQWSFYQSKAIREHIYKSERAVLGAIYDDRESGPKQAGAPSYEKAIKSLGEEESRFREEKKDIEKEARKLEAERNLNMAKDPYFDYAEVLLQIAIVLASISIVATSRPVFAASVVAAALGSFLCINGYLLIFKLPFFH